jgi:hypothetical protein
MKAKQNSQALTLVTHPEAFFHELVTQALGNQKVKVQPETEFYLVKLMQQFMTTDNLFPRDQNGSPKVEPLAFMIKEAAEESNSEAKTLLFRHVGDVSLYTAGYFQESLSRKLVDIDYYIDVGGLAYRQVAAQVDEKPYRGVYEELSHRFKNLVNVLSEVSEKTTPPTETNLLRTYENWINTRSDKAAKKLQDAGILTVNAQKPKKTVQ